MITYSNLHQYIFQYPTNFVSLKNSHLISARIVSSKTLTRIPWIYQTIRNSDPFAICVICTLSNSTLFQLIFFDVVYQSVYNNWNIHLNEGKKSPKTDDWIFFKLLIPCLLCHFRIFYFWLSLLLNAVRKQSIHGPNDWTHIILVQLDSMSSSGITNRLSLNLKWMDRL